MTLIPSASKWALLRGSAWLVLFLAMVSTALSPRAAAARTWHVPADAPTIQAGINLAEAGDDVLISPGTYFEHDINLKGGVWVHSEAGPAATVVDAGGVSRVFDSTGQVQTVILEGLTIRNGTATGQTQESGGGIRSSDSSLTIRRCLIAECRCDFRGGGVYATGEVDIEDSEIRDCSAGTGGGLWVWCQGPRVRVGNSRILWNTADSNGGMFVAGSPDVLILGCEVVGNVASWGADGGIGCYMATPTIKDCLIARNQSYDSGDAAAIGFERCSGSILGCTIADNGGWPPAEAIVLLTSDISFERTMITFSSERAVYRYYDARASFWCCDIYGNAGGDDFDGEDLGGNFFANPLFCNHDDYTLDGQSPCLPGWEHGGIDCGLIGARGQGCESTPTRPTTWGRIKVGYR